jgi:cyanophycinase
VWFTGGRQWRLVDRYLGTPTIDALQRLLARDGAVGGTSAGATICGDYLVRGDPLSNRIMMAEGYERGFGLLPGLAIDQHFTRRNRLNDLVTLKRGFPQLLAIGIDESTAAVFTGSTLRVVGNGTITVLDRPLPSGNLRAEDHFTLLNLEDRYDLRARKVVSRGGSKAP